MCLTKKKGRFWQNFACPMLLSWFAGSLGTFVSLGDSVAVLPEICFRFPQRLPVWDVWL